MGEGQGLQGRMVLLVMWVQGEFVTVCTLGDFICTLGDFICTLGDFICTLGDPTATWFASCLSAYSSIY